MATGSNGRAAGRRRRGSFISLCALAFLISITGAPGVAQGAPAAQGACAYVAIAGLVNGGWDLVLVDILAQRYVNLTETPSDERDPAWAPDGALVAYSANRGDNWDLYLYDLATGRTERLTDLPAYDGRPAWAPDGRRLLFESARAGSVDIFMIDRVSHVVTQLTSADGPEIEPLWLTDGSGFIFTAWRAGSRQLFLQKLTGGPPVQLTEPGEEPHQATLSAEGTLSYVQIGADGSRMVTRQPLRGSARAVFWKPAGSGDDRPPSSDRRGPTGGGQLGEGATLAMLQPLAGAASIYPIGWQLVLARPASDDPQRQPGPTAGGPLPAWPTDDAGPPSIVDGPAPPTAWGASSWGSGLALRGDWDQPACRPAGAPALDQAWRPVGELNTSAYLASQELTGARQLAPLPGVDAQQPVLSSAVDGSFRRLQERVIAESGYDYLGVLNDAWRGLDHPGGQALSWHRAGRAFDVRDWFATDRQRLYITREQRGDQTYFRIYLLARVQDGSRGRPLRESLWLTEGRRADAALLSNGGRYGSPPEGYFVDFTDLAAREHWTRIPALTAPSGDWRSRYLDMEFWHYERRGGLRWYAAMEELYSAGELDSRFNAQRLLSSGHTLQEIQNAGIPGAAPAQCAGPRHHGMVTPE